MGQCWAAQRKKGKGQSATQSKYQPTASDSRQPIVNGGLSTDVSAGVSQLSIDKYTQHISERENAGNFFRLYLYFYMFLCKAHCYCLQR